MSIPKSVDEAAEMAEQLHAQMYPQEQSENVNNDAEPEQEEETVQDDTSDNDVPHDDDLEALRKFKSKYLSLKGKYDAEVPRLHHELKEFKQSVFERLEQARQPDVKVETPTEDKFAKFKEEYGEDLFEAIRELAAQQAEEKFKSAVKPVQDQVASVEETQIKAAQQNFISYLDSTVKGDWKNLWAGNDAKFIEFLKQPDPSGLYTYGELVQAYNDNWDADKLTKVFNNYFDQTAPKTAPKQPRPEQNAMVAPSRSTQHSTPNASEKKIWTQESMREFQNADRANRYSPEDSKALWDDLLSAMSEGRIR